MKQNEIVKTTYLQDYTPSAFLISSVDLEFELNPQATRVTALMKIHRNPAGDQTVSSLMLDGECLELQALLLDDVLLSAAAYHLTDTQLLVESVPDSFSLKVVTVIKPDKNVSLEGLYVSGGNFCTQCEAEGFRKITYYLDRPDIMARFTVTLCADEDQYPVLLSNGNIVDRGQLQDGRHWVRWQDPFPKPSYLFALVAGRLSVIEDQFISKSGRNIELKIYVQAHNLDKCSHAMRSLKKAMQWDEETFDLEYDLDIYMIVAVDDFNMGAMENKGLNVFNSKYVLAKPDTATDVDYQNIESVIGHEYFHNWTGNRVTCRDWFQLSLKEGLTVFRDQEFSADMSARAVKRIEDVRMLRTVQYPEDAGPMAHPIRPSSYMEINNFYTVTIYEKGAEVIRMLQTLLTTEGFKKGVALYFQRHDGQAVTTEDFVQSMEDANNADLSQFKLWYTQAGTPRLTVSDRYEADTRRYYVTFQQSCPPTPGQPDKQPMHIPVAMGLLDSMGQEIPLGDNKQSTVILNLKKSQETFMFDDVPEKPVPSLLRGFSAPVMLDDGYGSAADRRLLMVHDTDSFNRWEAGQQYALSVLDALVLAYREKEPLRVPADFLDAFAEVLLAADNSSALIAETLRMPSEKYFAEQMSEIDVQAVFHARKHLVVTIAESLQESLQQCYQRLSVDEDYNIEPESIGRRSLKNLVLSYLMQSPTAQTKQWCKLQYYKANNMTDKLAALNMLLELQEGIAEEALDDFYQQYQKDALVLDKWFSVQALSKRPDTLDRVKRLVSHKEFSMKNPNKVYALLGAFSKQNPVHFHESSGAAYRFITECILELDAINPQVASRLSTVFMQWNRFIEPNKSLMFEQLQCIAKHSDLSKDTYEIVSKSLAI